MSKVLPIYQNGYPLPAHDMRTRTGTLEQARRIAATALKTMRLPDSWEAVVLDVEIDGQRVYSIRFGGMPDGPAWDRRGR